MAALFISIGLLCSILLCFGGSRTTGAPMSITTYYVSQLRIRCTHDGWVGVEMYVLFRLLFLSVTKVGGLRFLLERADAHQAGDLMITLEKHDPANSRLGGYT